MGKIFLVDDYRYSGGIRSDLNYRIYDLSVYTVIRSGSDDVKAIAQIPENPSVYFWCHSFSPSLRRNGVFEKVETHPVDHLADPLALFAVLLIALNNLFNGA